MSTERVLLAVDFTAETLRLLIAEPGGNPLGREEWPLPELADEAAWSWEVGGRIATLFARDGGQRSAAGIAVAAPGAVDAASGTLLRSTGQRAWDGLAVADALRRHIDAPIVAENRTVVALTGERWRGAAQGADDVLYCSLRGEPSAAALVGGRQLRGAHGEAGAWPAMPELTAENAAQTLETVAGLVADASALLDPAIVVLDADEAHVGRLVTLVQSVIDEVAPGPRVVASALGEDGPLIGAVLMAETVAYEGGFGP
ncbi:MAG: ROK family protein [Dehalococcoidia bacterium]